MILVPRLRFSIKNCSLLPCIPVSRFGRFEGYTRFFRNIRQEGDHLGFVTWRIHCANGKVLLQSAHGLVCVIWEGSQESERYQCFSHIWFLETIQKAMIIRSSQFSVAGWTETESLPTIRITGPRIETMGDLVNETLNPLFKLGLDPSKKDRYL